MLESSGHAWNLLRDILLLFAVGRWPAVETLRHQVFTPAIQLLVDRRLEAPLGAQLLAQALEVRSLRLGEVIR